MTRGYDPRGHRIEVETDRDGRVVDARFVCDLPSAAACRNYPACACESWDPELHGTPPAPGHEDVPQDECWVHPWLSYDGAEGIVETHEDADADVEILDVETLRDGPIEVEWHGDHLTWRYADETPARREALA